MQPSTFAEVLFEQYRKPTRRERFLDEMNRIVPWADLTAAIEPVYPKAEGLGRPSRWRSTPWRYTSTRIIRWRGSSSTKPMPSSRRPATAATEQPSPVGDNWGWMVNGRRLQSSSMGATTNQGREPFPRNMSVSFRSLHRGVPPVLNWNY